MMARGASTYDAIPDAAIVVDASGTVHQVNQAACDLAGATRSELIGGNSHEWFHPGQYSADDCPVCEHCNSNKKIQGYEIEDKKYNRWLDFTISPVVGMTSHDGVVEVIRNITHRKQVEKDLQELDDLKNTIVENLPAVLFVKKAEDLSYLEWNKEAETLTGHKKEDMLGKSDRDFFSEDEAESFMDMDNKVLAEGIMHDIPEETIHTRYKGVRVMHTKKIPIYDRNGDACYLLGISQDITESRETEEMLRRSQKMEAVGQLSGGIAHDFNNQLGIVTGYLEFLKLYVGNEEKQKGWVESASKAAQRCVDLTKQLLMFSRASASPEKIKTDINNSIKNLEDLIRKSVTPQIEISYQMEADLRPVTLDKSEFEDVIASLVSNARDATNGSGKIILRTSNVYLDADTVVTNYGVKPGEFIMLEIKDNGSGMSEEVLDHIYEPFFTTKQVGSGTGLGMSMVYSFVQRLDGIIKIDSSVGSGTSVKIYIPRTDDGELNARTELDPGRKMVLPEGQEAVLVVDDEADLLELTADHFVSLGYKVFKAGNGSEALELLALNKIDIVFSDIVMPGGINGYELAEKVMKKYPEVKMLLTSGYAAKSPVSTYAGIIVEKPYTRQDLAFRIREVLDADYK